MSIFPPWKFAQKKKDNFQGIFISSEDEEPETEVHDCNGAFYDSFNSFKIIFFYPFLPRN